MRFLRQLSRWFRSLRVRLTIWNTFVVLLAVVGALLSVREGLRFYLLAETDVVLNDEAKELLLAIGRWYPDQSQIIAEMEQKAAGHADRNWYIRWMNDDRSQTLWASPNAPTRPLDQLALTIRGYRVWSSETHRTVERRFEAVGLPAFYVRVGTPTQFIDDDVARLTRIAAPVALGIFLLAPLGGYFLSERAVHPLQEIIRTADRLRPSQMSDRLRIRGVGDELDQLASKINQFLDQIADHLRKNREFVANAAHELRSPLTAILSSVEVTVDKPRTPAEYEELLFSIDEECRHLTSLVNQLLLLTESESEATRQHFVPVPLDDVIRRSLEMFSPVAEERGVVLNSELSECPDVLGNRQQLRQLVTNLVDNAIKFTPPGGRVTCRLRPDDVDRGVVLTVEDSGIGIPPDDLPRIFERFYQVDRSRTRGAAARGNGLGLSICEAIVHGHQGAMQVESEVGKGTRFTLHFPAAPQPDDPAD